MPGRTVGGDESVWRKLGTALNQARQAEDDKHRLPGAQPVFYAAEQTGDRWLLLGESSLTPQQARDELAHQFLLRAADAADDSREQHDYRAAADVLDRERHDQMTTAGRHFQIVRIAQFLLMGSDGPETPAHGPSAPGANPSSPLELRFPGDADSDTSATTAALKAIVYTDAATTLERDQAYEVTAAGRRFRIAPVYRLIRVNATRPEPPRPSDFDPYPPPAA
jgi:Family of unknown function (DUF5954)